MNATFQISALRYQNNYIILFHRKKPLYFSQRLSDRAKLFCDSQLFIGIALLTLPDHCMFFFWIILDILLYHNLFSLLYSSI